MVLAGIKDDLIDAVSLPMYNLGVYVEAVPQDYATEQEIQIELEAQGVSFIDLSTYELVAEFINENGLRLGGIMHSKVYKARVVDMIEVAMKMDNERVLRFLHAHLVVTEERVAQGLPFMLTMGRLAELNYTLYPLRGLK